jgi:methylated-DNA-[protein]-cysteine S-methyltransferase
VGARYFSRMDSPIGPVLFLGDEDGLVALHLEKKRYGPEQPAEASRNDDVFAAAREQMAAYFKGDLKEFDVPLAADGTPFQKTVWRALMDIPFGETESYGALAKRIGHDGAARAVGLANGHNPIAIVVPCHRVIGSNGSLTGYGGGIERKKWLLEHERRFWPSKRARQHLLDW